MGLRSTVGQIGQPGNILRQSPDQEQNLENLLFDTERQTGLNQETLQDLFALDQRPEPQAQPIPAQAPPVQPTPVERAPAGEPSDQDILAALEGPEVSEADILDVLGAEGEDLKSAVQTNLESRGFFKNLSDRFVSGLGRNINESKSILQKRFGEDNVEVRDIEGSPELFVRSKKGGPFEQFDPAETEGVAKTLKEAGLDVADLGGDITEGVLATLVEMGIISTAAVTTGPVGVLPAAIGGIGVSAVAAEQARGEMVGLAGGQRDPELDSFAGQMRTAGINLGMAGTGTLATKIFNKARTLFRGSRPVETIKKVATINNEIDQMAKREFVPLSTDPEEAGKNVFGAIQNANDKTGREIGLFKNEAKEILGNKKVEPIAYEAQLKKTLRDANVSFDTTTGFAARTSETLNLGVPNGREIVNELIERHNDLITRNREGGFTMDKMFDEASVLGNKGSQLSREKKPNEARIFSEISNAMTTDKNELLYSTLQNTPSGPKVEAALDRYAKTIDNVREFRKLYRSSQENGELFMDSLIKKGNVSRIKKLKEIIGPESGDYKMLQSVWMNKRMKDATDTANGVFDARKFLESISDKNLGKEVRRELIPDADFNRIRVLANDYGKLDIKSITESPSAQAKLRDLLITSIPFAFPTARASAAFRLTKGNALAADYLLDEGFVKVAEEAASQSQKASLVEAKSIFQKIVANSRRVTRGGREILLETPAARNILRTRLLDGEPSVDEINLQSDQVFDTEGDALVEDFLRSE